MPHQGNGGPGGVLGNVLDKLQGVKQRGDRYQALCPGHEDREASLSVKLGEDGRVLLKCHAGCEPQAIVAAIGLTMKDLFPPRDRAGGGNEGRGKVVAHYDYHGAGGELLFQVLRYRPKTFRQRRPDGAGGWIWDMAGVEKVPYHLPIVLQAVQAGIDVFVVEGEKDVHTLQELGIPATCNAGGAGKWLKQYCEQMKGARLVILPDNDGPGRDHAQDVARKFSGLAASVKVVELPELPSKGDVSDWIRAGHTAAELQALVDAAPEWAPPAEEEPSARNATPEVRFPYTDLGNAERLIDAHGADLRYHEDSGKWLIWNGRCWQPDSLGGIDRLAREVVRKLYDLLKGDLSYSEKEKLLRHIIKSESRPRLEAMIALARHCSGIPVLSADLDSDPWLLNCENGTLDLRTGQLRPHSQEDLITKTIPVQYDPQASCPRWSLFLEEVFSGNAELIAFVKRMAGYMLTGDTRHECLFVLTGKGQNGKSKFVEALRALLGDYAQDTPMTSFTERKDGTSFELPGLAGARLVTAAEGEGKHTFNESLLKRMTGNDPITCCFKFKDYFTYIPTFKILFSTNEIPRIRSQNYAMKRRIKLIPFRQRFYDPEDGRQPCKDDQLRGKLMAELPGILRWAVEGCIEWAGDLKTPAIVRQEVERLFEDQDPLAEFLEAECLIDPLAEVEVGRLWEAYGTWCENHGRTKAWQQAQGISRNLCQRDGIDSRKGTGGVRLLTGIKLIGDPDRVVPSVLSGESGENSPNSETLPNLSLHEGGLQKPPKHATHATEEPEDEDGEAF